MEKFIHAFWHMHNMDYQKLRKIENIFSGNWQYAWDQAHYLQFQRVGFSAEFCQELIYLRGKLDIEKAFEKVRQAGIRLVGFNSLEYPRLLREIPDPPFMLYVQGSKIPQVQNFIAIVGTRKSTQYGETFAFEIAKKLAENEKIVVSGLAFGIDAAAHRGCIKVKKPTLAILASGIGKITPSCHYGLAQEILTCGGSIISEYPVTSSAFKQRFIERNRIISGMSEAAIIVEAQERSGSLITARHALEQNRMIFALPADIHKPQSKGCNKLIQKGEAEIISSIEDLFQSLGINLPEYFRQTAYKNLSSAENNLVGQLQKNCLSFDQLLEKTGLSLKDLQFALSNLEIQGLIFKNSSFEWELKY